MALGFYIRNSESARCPEGIAVVSKRNQRDALRESRESGVGVSAIPGGNRGSPQPHQRVIARCFKRLKGPGSNRERPIVNCTPGHENG